MEKSVKGEQLLSRWSIRPDQLLERIKKGLRAYTKDGREIRPIYSLPSRRRLAVRDIAKKRGQDDPRPDEAGVYRIDLDGPEALREVKGWYFPLKYVERFEPKHEKPDKKGILPCKAGTTWRQITITKKANDMVRIKTPQGQSLFTYHELGLQDGRSPDRPTKLWDLLIAFAERTGVIHSGNYRFDKLLPSRAKRLNKSLREIFGIKDSIYTEKYKKEKAYRTKIAFEDETF